MTLHQTLPDDLRAALSAGVEAGFDRQIALTREMVGHASQRGQEAGVQALLFAELEGRGLDMARVPPNRQALAAHPGAGKWSDAHSTVPVVIGTHQPREETGRSLILQGHVDVVPTGPEALWSSPPYAAEIRDGRIYGRGAGDMKSGLACAIAALDALRACGWQPAARVHLASVVEEESTGNGAMMMHLAGYRADAALIPEPTGESLVRANTGVIWFRVEFSGIPCHVSRMGEGENAIDAAIRTIEAMRGLERIWNDRRHEHPLFAGLAKPVNLNVGRIEGGEWASSVPATAAVDFRISLLPGWSAAQCAAEIERHLRDFAEADPYLSQNPPRLVWNGFMAEGYALEEGSAAETVLSRAHAATTGQSLPSHVMPAYLDARVNVLYEQIPALNYGPVAGVLHGIDEWVEIASLRRVTLAIALFIAEWCGLEPAEALRTG
ncbi:ArgE/DapE family deacylase [Mangrovicoccus algicola]|uniref:ArgE/DapE family deacylase n=1 Tax=Mangrovicoccus algicola TaxID=2771008 RepID=A0A8J7CH82_9RHOB|nr:ArgE/DapE family deacylase [Mangrovicoccus algicola]MBE3637950.1 ArgE/DapE family deacylase [Mangrovicoccus algicola]